MGWGGVRVQKAGFPGTKGHPSLRSGWMAVSPGGCAVTQVYKNSHLGLEPAPPLRIQGLALSAGRASLGGEQRRESGFLPALTALALCPDAASGTCPAFLTLGPKTKVALGIHGPSPGVRSHASWVKNHFRSQQKNPESSQFTVPVQSLP